MYRIVCSDAAKRYLSGIPDSDKAKVKRVISLCLGEYLKKITKRCNKKILKGSKNHTHRLQISMTYTIFYRIFDEDGVVVIIDAAGINQAHSRYGRE